ncbi:related to anther-expressed protein SLL2-S9 [Cephalotrichum gorgonifer]|uniref:Protein-lysine N-methyltransferase EFM4 n=1 Tax=Cephalotrichum gorgonifer TaxID=2041049 RepID=A0AAE8MWT7_9PEZI|nr:related to anther-expressed protein SLL2-S9 [Cephalotrichum gorgonifer]
MSTSHPAHLEPSKLGTKDYWDALYTTELQNHASNPEDTGTTWFSDSLAEEKLVALLPTLPTLPPPEQASFLDLGCGNGTLLSALRADGWAGRLMGVDYSERSVELARNVAAQDGSGAEFEVWDVLAGDYAAVLTGEQEGGWDVVTDKGTFDAICLSEEKDARGRRICEGYRDRVGRLVKRGGMLIITSCNWTEDELRTWFVGEGEGAEGEVEGEGVGFVEAGRIQYRTFSFGGHRGQTISTLCFRRT